MRADALRQAALDMSSTNLLVKAEHITPRVLRVGFTGNLSLETCKSLARASDILMDSETQSVIVDMGGVSYVSSTGVGALATLMKKARSQKGRLVLYRPNQGVQDVLSLLGFTQFFNVTDDESEARAIAELPDTN